MASNSRRKTSDHPTADAGVARRWSALNADLLVSIFERLGVADLITGVPFVCSSWRSASLDHRCWRCVDFRDWDHICGRFLRHRREFNLLCFPRLLSLAAERSGGLLEAIHFPFFADDTHLLCVSERCPKLLYFSLPSAEVEEKRFCEAVGKLQFLKGMAVDESLIRWDVLTHVNKCCIFLSELKVFAKYINEDIATIICKSLPCLKKLVITDCTLSSQAMITFLDGLSVLEHFDVSGYESSAITDVVLQKASRLKVFNWNSKFELGEIDCSNCEEDQLRRSCECMIEQRVMEWLTELS